MPTGLKRHHRTGTPHFLTFSCFRHRLILGTPEARDTFLEILEQTRERYRFQIHGYVVMPDHVHLILSEPEIKLLSVSMQVIKQRFSRTRMEEHIWEPRYYDFSLFDQDTLTEKLRYIHHNPVRRGLVEKPEDWQWSSFRTYFLEEPGPVTILRPNWQQSKASGAPSFRSLIAIGWGIVCGSKRPFSF